MTQDPRLQEAIHYLKKWEDGMVARWLAFLVRAKTTGFAVAQALQTKEVPGVGPVIVEGEARNSPGGVRVRSGNQDFLLHEAVAQWWFPLERLPALRETVQTAIDGFETELEKKIAVIPKLIDDFGVDAIDHALEKRDGK